MRYFHPAQPNELQCDLDDERALAQFKRGLVTLRTCYHFKVVKVVVAASDTPGHRHGRVWLDRPVPIMERIALQAALGDDPIRALMNWGRARNKDPHPVLLINHEKHLREQTRLSKPGIACFCGSVKRLPRCNCLRKLQSSRAAFASR